MRRILLVFCVAGLYATASAQTNNYSSTGDLTLLSGNRLVYDNLYDVHGYTKFDYSGMPEAAMLRYGYYGHRFATRSGLAFVIRGDNNRIGIGTSTPAATLDVRGKSLIHNLLGTNDYTYFGQHNGQIRITNGLGAQSSRALEFALLDNGTGVIQANEFNVGYNSLALNPVHGNVGIGNISPQSTLHVSGKTRVDNNLKVFGTDEGWAEGITIVKPSGWSGLRITRNDPSTGNFEGNWAIGYSGGSGNDLSISNHHSNIQTDHLFHISAATRFVGIGTSTPKDRLDINGSIRFNGNTPNFTAVSDNAVLDYVPTSVFATPRVRLAAIGTPSIGASISFLTGTQSSLAERMHIDPVGNVGIGTTDSKGYKLAIAGNVIAESVKVALLGTWPDYVFNSSYKLPDLKETEKFIRANKHLPEIPSAAEVQKEGIDLGEMNAKLLKKIEELTLHLIEKDKEIIKEKSLNHLQQTQLEGILKRLEALEKYN